MRLAGTLIVLVLASCHSGASSTPREASSVPALPPASGTVIGILVDDATALHLRTDQLDKLREIDAALVVRNEQIDGEGRAGERPVAGGGGGRRHQSGMGGGAKGRMAPPPPPGAHDLIRSPQQLQNQRTANNRDALDQALAVLDPDQVTAARKLLAEHGISMTSPKPEPEPEPAPAEVQ
jgi:hypothetical protein